MSINIFIGENEDKITVYKRLQGTLNTDMLADVIFEKTSNNKVGYYLFQDNDKYFKIYILPKHIPLPPERDEDKSTKTIKKFIEYLKIHYRLQQDHLKYTNNSASVESVLELSFKHNHAIYSVQEEIEDLSFFKFQYILKNIESFFKAHKSTKRKKLSYTAQTIKHRFDLIKNIKEPNKTKIHQYKYENIIYSEVANVTYGAIKLFMYKKVELIKNKQHKHDLSKRSQNIQRLLRKNFKTDSSIRLSLSKLVSNNTYKHFKKKKSFLKLYASILTLFGIERFYDGNDEMSLTRNIKSDAFLLLPDVLFEWYLYDQLKNMNYFKQNSKRYEICLDKDTGTAKGYDVVDKLRKQPINVNSVPDITIKDKWHQKLFIIDAKWKFLGMKRPELPDILKLKRDCEVRRNDYSTYAILVYPYAKERLIQEFLYKNKQATFSFYVKQISLEQTNIAFTIKDILEESL